MIPPFSMVVGYVLVLVLIAGGWRWLVASLEWAVAYVILGVWLWACRRDDARHARDGKATRWEPSPPAVPVWRRR